MHYYQGPWTSHFPRKTTCSSARNIEWSASSAIQAKSCFISDTLKSQAAKISLKNRPASEQDRAPQSRSWTQESCVRNISSTSKPSTMSAQTSRRDSIGFSMQLCGQPWRSTTSALTRLKPISNDNSIFPISKIWLMCSVITSMLQRIQAIEMRCPNDPHGYGIGKGTRKKNSIFR